MLKIIKQILNLLDKSEQKQAKKLVLLMFVTAFFDAAGVASIMPFFALLGDPGIIANNYILANIYEFLEVEKSEFQLILGMMALAVLLLSLTVKAKATHMQLKFAYGCEYSIGKRLVDKYFSQKYEWFLERNSSDLSKVILSEVGLVVNMALMPLMVTISQGALVVSMVILLIIVDPALTAIILVVFGGGYGVIIKLLSNKLVKVGLESSNANQERYKVISEAFGAVKEIKLNGLEKSYVGKFSKYAEIFAKNQAFAQITAQLPRFLLEGLAFGGMIGVVIFLISTRDTLAQALPVIALYGLAGYKLMPSLQQLYGSLSQIKFSKVTLNRLEKELDNLMRHHNKMGDLEIDFKKNIELLNIKFKYSGAANLSLNGVNLNIPINQTIGIIGKTGSGKTTLVDVLLGLLVVQDGYLLVDGVKIDNSNRKAWQSKIGYVPQSIYLLDDSVSSNIAFGVEKNMIDQERLIKAAKMANLHEFITNNLLNGYDTVVGERGVKLSGGQRQRIGIARAIYKNPKVLILDEATSALDNTTENVVMDAINKLAKKMTIIIIAHRLTTLNKCNIIYSLEDGKIKEKGTYEMMVK